MIVKNHFKAAAVLLALTTTFALSACTNASNDDAAATAAPSATPNEPDTAPPFVGEQGEVIPAEDIANDPDLYGAVALTGCAATEGGWLATGTATNAGSSTQDFHIVLNVTDAQARTITSVVVDVTADAGETAEWEAPANISAPADSSCVIAGVSSGE